jgi:hypothetical protein
MEDHVDSNHPCRIDAHGSGATWSPDGQWLLFLGTGGQWDMRPYSVSTGQIPKPPFKEGCSIQATELSPVEVGMPPDFTIPSRTMVWSTDSKWILYPAMDANQILQILKVKPGEPGQCHGDAWKVCATTVGGGYSSGCKDKFGEKFFPASDGESVSYVEVRLDDKCGRHEEFKAIRLDRLNDKPHVLSTLAPDFQLNVPIQWRPDPRLAPLQPQ